MSDSVRDVWVLGCGCCGFSAFCGVKYRSSTSSPLSVAAACASIADVEVLIGELAAAATRTRAIEAHAF
eukprot:503190-Prymnesium_polylepis.1